MKTRIGQITRRKWRMVLLCCILALMIAALDCRLLTRTYKIDSEKINTPVRIALVTDLHACYYGTNQKTLIAAIEKQNPDVVLLGGDIFDDERDNTNTEIFLTQIADRYPCYYVTGNHEIWSEEAAYYDMMAFIENCGIVILHDTVTELEFGETRINLCGMDDPSICRLGPNGSFEDRTAEQLDTISAMLNNDNYTILLSHRPTYFETEYQNRGFDLILCGHAHGGQVRIPFLLNGLYAPNEGMFPKFAGGRYDTEDCTMIVSRGLARESTAAPRIFNRPELVILELS